MQQRARRFTPAYHPRLIFGLSRIVLSSPAVLQSRYMLLQDILHRLDAELQRLTSLRTIVVSLKPAREHVSPESTKQLASPSKGREKLRPIARPRRIAPGSAQIVHRAESGPAQGTLAPVTSFPRSQVVVVSAHELAQERVRRSTSRTVQASDAKVDRGMTADLLAKDLAARWLTGPGAAKV